MDRFTIAMVGFTVLSAFLLTFLSRFAIGRAW